LSFRVLRQPFLLYALIHFVFLCCVSSLLLSKVAGFLQLVVLVLVPMAGGTGGGSWEWTAAGASHTSCRSGSIHIYFAPPPRKGRSQIPMPAAALWFYISIYIGIYVYVVQREPTPGGPGSGLRPGRKRHSPPTADKMYESGCTNFRGCTRMYDFLVFFWGGGSVFFAFA
jgi:hypothetical protein